MSEYTVTKQNKANSIKLQYGLKDGKVISIYDVPNELRGLKCGCTCPGCGMKLQAKLGNGKRQPHFSHNNVECDFEKAQQTALHMLAKEIIEEEKVVMCPPIAISFEETSLYQSSSDINELYYQYPNEFLKPVEYKSSEKILFEFVELEKRISSFVPDVVAYTGEEKYLIEIAVTHLVDKDKEKKLVQQGLPVLEIDVSSQLSKALSKETLKKIIVNQVKNKKWVYTPLWKDAMARAEQEYQIKIGNLKKKKKEQWQRQIEQEKIRQEQLESQDVFRKENYIMLVKGLRNNNQYRCIYENSEMYKENPISPFYLDIPIRGEFVFSCDRRVWQTFLFEEFVYNNTKRNEYMKTPISFTEIINCFIQHQSRFSINLQQFPTIQNEDLYEWSGYDLMREVVRRYLIYLDDLGFIVYDFETHDNKKCYVLNTHTLIPPNKEKARALEFALKNVDGLSPDIDEQIDQYIRKPGTE